MYGELIISLGLITLLIYGLIDNKINLLVLLTYVLAMYSIGLETIDCISLIKLILIMISIPFLLNQPAAFIARYEYTIILTTTLLGMLLLVTFTNLLAIYLALELQSLSS